jgi:hypothetical protein
MSDDTCPVTGCDWSTDAQNVAQAVWSHLNNMTHHDDHAEWVENHTLDDLRDGSDEGDQDGPDDADDGDPADGGSESGDDEQDDSGDTPDDDMGEGYHEGVTVEDGGDPDDDTGGSDDGSSSTGAGIPLSPMQVVGGAAVLYGAYRLLTGGSDGETPDEGGPEGTESPSSGETSTPDDDLTIPVEGGGPVE